VVTTLAGLAGSTGSADGTGSAARFTEPYGVAVDSAGNVYVADTYNHTIRKVTPAGVVTTLAGLARSIGSADGTGSAARFFYPYGVAVDSGGNVYVADSYNNTIRKVTPAGVVTTLAGLAGSPGSADGTGSAARFTHPFGVAVDSAGNFYVADRDNHTIRKGVPTPCLTNSCPLVITCPSNIVVVTCSTNVPVTWSIMATGACSSVTVTSSPPSGTIFRRDTTSTVTAVATDGSGNTATCSFLVIVRKPTLNITMSSSGSPVTVTITWLDGGILQQANSVLGPWTDIPLATSPYTTAASVDQKFYRLRCP
jgi:hypothetical protein